MKIKYFIKTQYFYQNIKAKNETEKENMMQLIESEKEENIQK